MEFVRVAKERGSVGQVQGFQCIGQDVFMNYIITRVKLIFSSDSTTKSSLLFKNHVGYLERKCSSEQSLLSLVY